MDNRADTEADAGVEKGVEKGVEPGLELGADTCAAAGVGVPSAMLCNVAVSETAVPHGGRVAAGQEGWAPASSPNETQPPSLAAVPLPPPLAPQLPPLPPPPVATFLGEGVTRTLVPVAAPACVSAVGVGAGSASGVLKQVGNVPALEGRAGVGSGV